MRLTASAELARSSNSSKIVIDFGFLWLLDESSGMVIRVATRKIAVR
jgi:hypothetical protein